MIKRACALIALAAPAAAGDISLIPPIACDLASDCYIQQYVDQDPFPGARDFSCGGLSYDGHKGTDFAVPDLTRMAQGVDVLASAAGTVKGLRDGMPDTGYSAETSDDIDGRECGNGVVLDHGDGWETQYCHMKQGSLTVAEGQSVKAGDVLGSVGMSGRAQFPHVHLSLRRNGIVVDPFDPDGVIVCHRVDPDTLWSKTPPYRPGGIVSVGITNAVPEFSRIKKGTAADQTLDHESEALVVFGYFFGTQEGDLVELSLDGPTGEVAAQSIQLKKAQALSFRAVGKKRRGAPWPPGKYQARVALIRADTAIEERTTAITLP